MAFNINIAPATVNLAYAFTNNNTIEGNGGYIQIYVNSSNVVYDVDTISSSFNVNVGDQVDVSIYTYANTYYGTATELIVSNPIGTVISNQYDYQPNPGSPSSATYTWNAVAGGITITASSNSA